MVCDTAASGRSRVWDGLSRSRSRSPMKKCVKEWCGRTGCCAPCQRMCMQRHAPRPPTLALHLVHHGAAEAAHVSIKPGCANSAAPCSQYCFARVRCKSVYHALLAKPTANALPCSVYCRQECVCVRVERGGGLQLRDCGQPDAARCLSGSEAPHLRQRCLQPLPQTCKHACRRCMEAASIEGGVPRDAPKTARLAHWACLACHCRVMLGAAGQPCDLTSSDQRAETARLHAR